MAGRVWLGLHLSACTRGWLTPHPGRPLQERVRELEEAAMADKAWHLRGEVEAMHRPKDSVLEVDMDFDTTGARCGHGV